LGDDLALYYPGVVAMRRLRIMSLTVLTTFVALMAALLVAVPSASSAPVPTLREIRAAHHPGFDRLVFEFSGGLPEFTRTRWVDEVIQDPSGRPARVAGNAFLEVVMFNVRAHEDAAPFASTYGPGRRAYDLPNIATVVNSGDFEAVVSFGVGLMRRTSILDTSRLVDPPRYVVDVQTNFDRQRVRVYFQDSGNFNAGTAPYRRAVTRGVPVPGVANGALHRMYAGPTEAEWADGLRLVRSTSTGFADLRISTSEVARVRLTGGCDSGGSTFTVANLMTPTLRQFPTVNWVKIYSPSGQTERPTGLTDSIPICLEP
jgi:hypothetical protein